MQKLINVLALTSFCVSAGVVAGGTYLYLEKDNIIQDVRENVAGEIQGLVEDSLVSGLNSSVPGGDSLPSGGDLVPETSVPGIPF